MTAKVCPRCGTQYEDLKSTTCPECFARLLVVDEATAEELRAAREQVVQTPEFQATKAIDDERFREQSFGACLGVAVIALITAIAIAVFISVAAHRSHPPSQTAVQPKVTTAPASLDILTPLPVAAAQLNDVLPPSIGPYQRVSQDQTVTLAATVTPIFHAVYSDHAETLQTYAVPASLPTPQQNQFRQGVELAAQIEAAPTQSFATEHWHYAVVGPAHSIKNTPSTVDQFRQALGTYFRQLSP